LGKRLRAFFKQDKEKLPVDYFAEHYVSVSEGEIKSWLKLAPTREFLRVVNELKKLEDSQVHISLAEGRLEDADRGNAALIQLKEVLGVPSIMIENAKEED